MKTFSPGARKVLKIVNIGFLFSALILIIFNLTKDHGSEIVGDFIQLIALICALLYCLYGYKKNAAIYYKIFLIGYLISRVFFIIAAMKYGDVISINIICDGIIVIGLILLFAVKNLGKKKSLILGFIIILSASVLLVFAIIKIKVLLAVFGPVSCLVNAIILNLFILAKYEDKAERGTT